LTDIEIIATDNDLVRLILVDNTLTSILVLYPPEAERIAQAMLKAVEHIKSKEKA